MKKLLSIILAILMIVTTVPFAFAAGYADAIKSITIDGTAITNVTGKQEGTDWSYDGTKATPTIYLDNYNGGAIYVKGKSDVGQVPIEIDVKGNCNITATNEAIKLDADNAGTIRISTHSGSTLTTNSWSGIYNAAKKNPIVEFLGSGKVKINANGGYGIWAQQNPIINEFSVAGSILVSGLVYVEANAPATVATYGYSADGIETNNVNFKVSNGASVKFTKTDASNPHPIILSPETVTVNSGYIKSLSEDGTVFRLYKPVAYAIFFEGSSTLIPEATTNEDGTLSSLPTPTAPVPSWKFEGWYTAEEGGEKVTTDTVFTSNTTLYARWKQTYTVNVSADSEDHGTVNIYPVRDSYVKGDEVIVGAFEKEGYTFKEWQENGTKVSEEKNYSFTVENNRNLVAVFKAKEVTPPVTYTVEAYEFPLNSGTFTGAGTYNAGDTVTLTATPKEGYRFVAWRNIENTTDLSTEPTYTFTVSEDTFVMAKFEKATIKYTVEAYEFPLNSGTFTGAGTYNAGDTVTLTATPKEGYRFVAWRNIENTTDLSTEPTYTFTVSEDTFVMAKFEKVEGGETPPTEYDITVNGGTASANKAVAGTSITLTAEQIDGKVFSHWEVNGATVSDANAKETTFTMGNADVTAEAVYKDCECNCHKGGIEGFFFKFVLFFQKIFGMNTVCGCQMNHNVFGDLW